MSLFLIQRLRRCDDPGHRISVRAEQDRRGKLFFEVDIDGTSIICFWQQILGSAHHRRML
jgi:hypothetical protein